MYQLNVRLGCCKGYYLSEILKINKGSGLQKTSHVYIKIVFILISPSSLTWNNTNNIRHHEFHTWSFTWGVVLASISFPTFLRGCFTLSVGKSIRFYARCRLRRTETNDLKSVCYNNKCDNPGQIAVTHTVIWYVVAPVSSPWKSQKRWNLFPRKCFVDSPLRLLPLASHVHKREFVFTHPYYISNSQSALTFI